MLREDKSGTRVDTRGSVCREGGDGVGLLNADYTPPGTSPESNDKATRSLALNRLTCPVVIFWPCCLLHTPGTSCVCYSCRISRWSSFPAFFLFAVARFDATLMCKMRTAVHSAVVSSRRTTSIILINRQQKKLSLSQNGVLTGIKQTTAGRLKFILDGEGAAK